MLHNWLRPVPENLFLPRKRSRSGYFESHLRIYHNAIPELGDIQVAIVGIGEETSNLVRKHLYRFNFAFPKLRIADLGNIRKEENAFVLPVIKELLDGKILPILIGPSEQFTLAQFQAYNSRQLINLAIIDEKIRYNPRKKKSDDLLNRIFQSNQSKLFHLGAIGYQTHFTPNSIIKQLEKQNFDYVRLGNVRANIEEIEPFIRDADFMSFNLASLRQSEAPGVLNPSPNGFFAEEACQISRYAGMSDKLSSIGFYGYNMANDRNEITAQMVSQLIWYFLDGYFHRKNDFPASTDGLMEYIVDFKTSENQLTFWKSTKSGRWWMQVPLKIKKKHQRHKLVPCSYKDYLAACREDLSNRLLNAYKRFT